MTERIPTTDLLIDVPAYWHVLPDETVALQGASNYLDDGQAGADTLTGIASGPDSPTVVMLISRTAGMLGLR